MISNEQVAGQAGGRSAGRTAKDIRCGRWKEKEPGSECSA